MTNCSNVSSEKFYLESWIESLEIVNAKEMVVHHRDVFTNSNLVALTWFPIRPAHYYAGKDSSATTLEPPVGSGPYRVADFDRDFVRYKRVENYWAGISRLTADGTIST